MQRTVEGDCEVQYTFNKHSLYGDQHGTSLEIVKSINTQKCMRRVDIRYGNDLALADERKKDDCCAKQEHLTTESSTIYHYFINEDDDQFLIKRAEVRSHHTFAPFGTESVGTFITGKLELLEVTRDVRHFIVPDHNVGECLQYSTEREAKVEKFMMLGDDEYTDDLFYHSPGIYEQIKKAINELTVSLHEDSEETLTNTSMHVTQLAELFRMCPNRIIMQIHERFFKNNDGFENDRIAKSVRDILLDTYVMAGTKNTIDYIIKQIETGHISVSKAISLIMNFVNIRFVSKEQIDDVYELCMNQVCQKDTQLRQACLLTVGGMINRLCAANQVQLALHYSQEKLCPRQVKEKYLNVSSSFKFFC